MKIVPILLAAGESKRMGYLKPLCNFDGKTALELALDTCREAGVADPIVVLGHEREKIEDAVPLHGATVVFNENYVQGQTSSLQRGLAALPDDASGFLLWPVDYPLIRADDVQAVIDAREKHHARGKRIFIPSYGLKRGHPALIDIELKPDFDALPEDAPARTVINRQAARIHHVSVDQSYVLMDMDTKDEYDTCLREYRKREQGR